MKPNSYIKLSTSLVMFFGMLIFSCGSKKNITNNETSIASNPKIIFLNYSVKKTDDDHVTISFINQIIADGKLKPIKANNEGEKGDFVYAQLDKNSNILLTEIIKNPFVKVIEYVDDFNVLQKKQIELYSTQIAIRLQLKPNAKYISINKYNKEKSNAKPLIITKVN